jgi:hypothetical protein
MRIYQIADEIREFMDRVVTDHFGELTPELENEYATLTGKLKDKLMATAYVYKHHGIEIAAIDVEIKRLQARKKALVKTQEWLEKRISFYMDEFGVDKLKEPTAEISFRKSERVEVDEAMIENVIKEENEKHDNGLKLALQQAISNGAVSVEVASSSTDLLDIQNLYAILRDAFNAADLRIKTSKVELKKLIKKSEAKIPFAAITSHRNIQIK